MFGLSKRARSRDKWRTEPILRTHQGHLLPIPDLIALTDEVIYRAGVPDVDPARVQGTMMQDIENRCSELLARHVNAGAAAGMTMLKEGYAKPSLKKCRPIAARNEDKKVFSGRL